MTIDRAWDKLLSVFKDLKGTMRLLNYFKFLWLSRNPWLEQDVSAVKLNKSHTRSTMGNYLLNPSLYKLIILHELITVEEAYN